MSPFISSEPILFEITLSSKEYSQDDTLHLCEDKRSSSPTIDLKPLHAGPENVVLDFDRDTTSTFHDESLEIENQ